MTLLVDRLDPGRFRSNIDALAAHGTRYWNQQGNADAADWLQQQLDSYGLATQRHAYTYKGETRQNIYATRVGSKRPDQVYILGAHFDSYNTQSQDGLVAPGADDNASGASLVLEAARVFAASDIETEISIRFVLFNNEETGLNGSEAYVNDRQAMQGDESPPGSGNYPEPRWLGMISPDMILFDHGLPPAPQQSPDADIDVEYRDNQAHGKGAAALADALLQANRNLSLPYPAEVGSEMSNTDSMAFEDACPAISVRENRRLDEIGNGSNPHWHKSSDVVSTYSDDDFALGVDAVRTVVGALAALVAVRVTGP